MNSMTIAPDLRGAHYCEVLLNLHRGLKPATYFEIGTESGLTLELSEAHSIAVDPKLQIYAGTVVNNKPVCHLYQQTSDQFFSTVRPTDLVGRPIDLAFLDGMHQCEFLLRDFVNTERYCAPDSVIVLHDCVPLDDTMTPRVQADCPPPLMPHRAGWWTGDVWRTALALKRFRPDLQISTFDAQPTGLIVITGLTPDSTILSGRYDQIVREMMAWQFDFYRYVAEMRMESVSTIATVEAVCERYPNRFARAS